MDLFSLVMWIIGSVWSVFRMLYSFVTGIPVIGGIIETVLVVGIIWLAYRHTPAGIRTAIRHRIGPYLNAATRGLRRFLVRLMADPDMFPRPRDGEPQVVYKEVRVTRSLRSNVLLRIRWFIAGIAATYAGWHWQAWWPHVPMPW